MKCLKERFICWGLPATKLLQQYYIKNTNIQRISLIYVPDSIINTIQFHNSNSKRAKRRLFKGEMDTAYCMHNNVLCVKTYTSETSDMENEGCRYSAHGERVNMMMRSMCRVLRTRKRVYENEGDSDSWRKKQRKWIEKGRYTRPEWV